MSIASNSTFIWLGKVNAGLILFAAVCYSIACLVAVQTPARDKQIIPDKMDFLVSNKLNDENQTLLKRIESSTPGLPGPTLGGSDLNKIESILYEGAFNGNENAINLLLELQFEERTLNATDIDVIALAEFHEVTVSEYYFKLKDRIEKKTMMALFNLIVSMKQPCNIINRKLQTSKTEWLFGGCYERAYLS